jgi:hypothetical protein
VFSGTQIVIAVLRAEADSGEALRQVEAAAVNLGIEKLPGFVGKLEQILATAWLRLRMPATSAAGEDRLLDAKQAASMLGIEVSSLYRRRWPFRVEVSPGRTRYSLRGIERFIRAREGR